jgi:acetoin utilization deacetylase AcuC-like enzyme
VGGQSKGRTGGVAEHASVPRERIGPQSFGQTALQRGQRPGGLVHRRSQLRHRSRYLGRGLRIGAGGAVRGTYHYRWRSAFALCRPPGHHAFADRASGFCFLNNAAIAAELIGNRTGKVAILDFGTHHGDGTQAIFYGRKDVLFASVHTDPTTYYPYFSGYADERGEGEGLGATVNAPLAPGSGDEAFLEACRTLVKAVRTHKTEVLVVSAGWDAHRDDPLSLLDVSTDAFARVGELLADLQLPTLIVQEGGYSLEACESAAAFIGAFCSRHKPT